MKTLIVFQLREVIPPLLLLQVFSHSNQCLCFYSPFSFTHVCTQHLDSSNSCVKSTTNRLRCSILFNLNEKKYIYISYHIKFLVPFIRQNLFLHVYDTHFMVCNMHTLHTPNPNGFTMCIVCTQKLFLV